MDTAYSEEKQSERPESELLPLPEGVLGTSPEFEALFPRQVVVPMERDLTCDIDVCIIIILIWVQLQVECRAKLRNTIGPRRVQGRHLAHVQR